VAAAVRRTIETVNEDLKEIRGLIVQYRQEQKKAQGASEKVIESRALDSSSISVMQRTLKQIYDLIEQDEKAQETKQVKLPKSANGPRSGRGRGNPKK